VDFELGDAGISDWEGVRVEVGGLGGNWENPWALGREGGVGMLGRLRRQGLVKYQLSQKPSNEVWERGFWLGVVRFGYLIFVSEKEYQQIQFFYKLQILSKPILYLKRDVVIFIIKFFL